MADSMRELYSAFDDMDAEGFANLFTEDAFFRFGSAAPATGRANIREAVAAFFSTIEALHHDVTEVWDHGDVSIAEVEVTYTRKDGDHVTLPAADIVRRSGDRIRDYRIFMDRSGLY